MPRLVALPAILFAQVLFGFAAFFLRNAPFMTSPMAPVHQWADGPMKLVTTPQYETNKTDIFTTGATHMALLHNSIIRGYNSIYLQAPHVQDVDKADFIGYCQTWFKFVKSHHDDEEDNLFPKVKELLGDEAIWTETHKEHESFLGGLAEFTTYLSKLPTPTALSGTQLVRIMASFQDDFENHFHSEIKTIAAIAEHPKVPANGTAEGDMAFDTFKAWGKNTVQQAGLWDVVPFFLVNLDVTAEGGMWKKWPPMPPPIKWGLMNIAGSWYSSWWKFSSCDHLGQPQELYALRGLETGAKQEVKDEL